MTTIHARQIQLTKKENKERIRKLSTVCTVPALVNRLNLLSVLLALLLCSPVDGKGSLIYRYLADKAVIYMWLCTWRRDYVRQWKFPFRLFLQYLPRHMFCLHTRLSNEYSDYLSM